ncbi:Eco57I restriction-modification methylase domain-containing protein [Roseivirga spongicola]|uniref:Eco57I restriction-modification methylase domain-containing protein n=1 Tax=Roseivirga spongicola TaxID=333140 RepID=UPI002AC9B596|nr:N-6 DNA methylase [Roseivirga spongicola]WPZ09760.1 N-6 DNA methylase [Roseivirga spongicola]
MNALKTIQEDFYEGLKAFFEELNIPINYLAEEPAKPTDILSENYNNSNHGHQLMDDIYFLGIVNDETFEEKDTFQSGEQFKNAIKSDYDGIVLLGITLKDRENGLLPTRSQLADITRAFNREFKYTPVTIVFKYGNYISFANSERLKFKQEWREGEKAGKVSILREIDLSHPHSGHIAILNSLSITSSGRNAITSYQALYFYWQSVFSISVLNKRFYEEVIKWFNSAIKEIQIPSEKVGSEKHKDFVIRLIARLIFIWFLKELKVIKEDLLLPELKNGENNDLIIPKSAGSSYYKFILQNLFFNALNAEQNERDQSAFDVFASGFTAIDELKEFIFFSPYLNGGLFDVHPNDWMEEGKANNAFQVPDHLFLDKESGINSILARYKFTIAENTPLEEEIAVDPEMLGRIFENLLAEQSDDTKEAARKNAGAFYTPRPVVSYMCRNTLMKHLDTEITSANSKQVIHKMLETTVLDPACGSGAFPMGMLEEMMQVLEAVDPEGNLWIAEMLKSKDDDFLEHISDFIADKQIRYVKKLGLLRNCLFGVDLLEYAVEITKLRCWLSLIVEQKVDFDKPNYNLKPLPNLEFKFYKKNSLLRFYKDQNLNQLIDTVDNEELLDELVNLENEYFIVKSSRHGNKEEIKQKIIALLEKVVDSKTEQVQKLYKVALDTVNHLVSSNASENEIKKAKKKAEKLANELAELAGFRETIKDYFIERVVFPGIFSKHNENPGFDIVIGNPPYVNTKQISSMGLTKKLEAEYGYCDDLYNHFTIRGMELTKRGGLLSYITSDTFLTLQTKKNMRMEFLGISNQKITEGQGQLFGTQLKEHFDIPNPDLFGNTKPIQGELIPTKQKSSSDHYKPYCRVTDIINTPKAFAALVDTAIFTLKKEQAKDDAALVYVDLRKPTAESFEISEEEWANIKTSKENLASWERILEHTFNALGHKKPAWTKSHTCDGEVVFKDDDSTLLKFKLTHEPYRKAINYAIFAPTPYNCQVLEKIIKPARKVYDQWWDKIETSRAINNNRSSIKKYTNTLKAGDMTLIGLITDGGQGLATGNNGRFVGYKEGTRFADRCIETRTEKLYAAIEEHPDITSKWSVLSGANSKDDVASILKAMDEQSVWTLFDEIKNEYGLRVFGKGYLYRIIPETLEFDTSNISETEKNEGINSEICWVPYDKGDREGNRWYLETPYLIDWSIDAVAILSTDERARWQGYTFFFRNGFCWSDVLNPNSIYIKCRLKAQSVNDVKSMSLYDEIGIGDQYIVSLINSFLHFKILREFLNGTVAIQINDIRKMPIKIPSDTELNDFRAAFGQCLNIQKKYFSGEIEKGDARTQLKPIEDKIDQMVNQFYDITAEVTTEEIGEKAQEQMVEE